MEEHEIDAVLSQGREAFKSGDTSRALESFETLILHRRTPEICSYLAFCLAKEKSEFKEAISLGNEAIRKDPKDISHFLMQGRVLVMAGRRKEAHRVFLLGLRQGASPQIEAELRQLGMRKSPVFPFLRREHPLNKYVGKLLSRLGLR